MNLLLYSNLFVSLCAAALVSATRVLLGSAPTIGWLEAHVFFATMTVYNVDRLVDGDADLTFASPRHEWIANHRRLLWAVTGASALGTLGTMVMLPMRVVLGLVPLAIVSFLYSVPFLGGTFRLKAFTGAKTFVIAFVWAVVTALLPALALDAPFPAWLLAERFIFIFAITMPFELRDLDRDTAAGIRSVGHILGAQRTVVVSVAMLVGFAASSAVHFRAQPVVAVVLALSGVSTAMAVWPSVEPRSDIYYSALLDGTMLVQAALVLAGATG